MPASRCCHGSLLTAKTVLRLRELIATQKALPRKLEALKKKYDAQLSFVLDAIRQLTAPPPPKKRKVGFLARERACAREEGGCSSFRPFSSSQNVGVTLEVLPSAAFSSPIACLFSPHPVCLFSV
jgi:hypothetical protein